MAINSIVFVKTLRLHSMASPLFVCHRRVRMKTRALVDESCCTTLSVCFY